jgi:hypothetical protein
MKSICSRLFWVVSASAALLAFQGCGKGNASNTPTEITSSEENLDHPDYWFQGLAELSSYHLSQDRYGGNYEGHVVLVYVTEPFSESKQVKVDDPGKAQGDNLTVLKLNAVKKFTTGIYPYSIMTSVFEPYYEDGHALKVTSSVQEWCGHAFTQLNHQNDSYRFQQFSYFESDGDLTGDVDDCWLEDEIWTQIRVNPEELPMGRLQMVPGTEYLRLKHVPLSVQQVDIVKTIEGEYTLLNLFYPELERTLNIRFRSAYPHEIEEWVETSPSMFGGTKTMSTTKASLNKRIISDYWSNNGVDDGEWRRQLGLE